MKLQLAALGVSSELFELVRIGRVDFGGNDNHRFFEQAVAEAGEFVVDHFEVFDRVEAARCIGHIDEVSEDASPLNMAKKLGAEARALVCAFDEARDVGHYEGLLVRFFADGDDAEIRFEGGERVVGDLGLGGRDPGDEGGFARVGLADQPDVG